MSIVKTFVIGAIALVTFPLVVSAQKPAKPPKPDGTPTNPAIAYEARTRQAYWDLMVMDADGANPTRLVSGGDNRSARWSPDGEWIAFSRARVANEGIYIVRPDGTGLCRIAATSGLVILPSPVWSPRPAPSGHYKILYAEDSPTFGLVELFAVDAVCGANVPQLVTSPQGSVGHVFDWSENDVLAVQGAGGSFTGLFVHDVLMDAAGAVTLGPGLDLTASGPLFGQAVSSAAWTEDGAELVVAAHARNSSTDLWVISGSTTGVAQRLTDTPDIYETGVTWSPDFTRVAFDRQLGGILMSTVEALDGVWNMSEPVTLAAPTRLYPAMWRPHWRRVP